MQIQQIRTIAKQYGVKPGHSNKMELIRDIQRAEGNFDCFAKAISGDCDQENCRWRDDCFTVARKRHHS